MLQNADKFYRAQITKRREVSNDLWAFQANPNGEYQFKPGQYATLGVVTPEKVLERAYSIVSAPHEKFLEFFIAVSYTHLTLPTNREV